MNHKPVATLSALILVVAFATPSVLSQDKSGTQKTADQVPSQSATTPTLPTPAPSTDTSTFIDGNIMVFYDGSITNQEAIKYRDAARAWAKYKVVTAGIHFEEYDIRNDVSRKQGQPSPKAYYYDRVPRAKSYVDNLEGGETLAVRARITSDRNAQLSQPMLIGGPLDPREQLDLLMKPIMQFSQKKLSTTSEFVDAWLLFWYDSSIKDEEVIKMRDNTRARVKKTAIDAGIRYFEYSIRDDVSKKEGEPSPKQYYNERIPRAKAYIDNLEAGEVVAVTVRQTRAKGGENSYPISLGGPIGSEELVNSLIKPISLFAKKPVPAATEPSATSDSKK